MLPEKIERKTRTKKKNQDMNNLKNRLSPVDELIRKSQNWGPLKLCEGDAHSSADVYKKCKNDISMLIC